MKLQFCKSDIPKLAEEYWDYFTDRYPEQAERERQLIDMRDEVYI